MLKVSANDADHLRPSKAKILVGTSGWYYKHWLGKFYRPDHSPREMLRFYAGEFSTVEINNTFYRLPERSTFRSWKKEVPSDFTFAVKASRFITHIKRLRAPKDPIDLLLERAAPLGESLGPVLFQLPPQWKLNLERLRNFLDCLPGSLQAVIEFRDPTWYVDEVYDLLRRKNVAMCLHDWRGIPWPQELTADFTYIRFHGYKQSYGGNYPNSELKKWAGKIRGWRPRLTQIYVYFNNDANGHAISNARFLRLILGLARRGHEILAA